MKKTNNNNIIFNSQIENGFSKGGFDRSKIINALLVLSSVIASIYVFISSFSIEHNNIIILATIMLSVLFFSYIINKFKEKLYPFIISLFVYLLAAVFLSKYIIYGFMAVWDSVAKAVYNNTNYSAYLFNYEFPEDCEVYISIFFIFVAILLSAFISIIVNKKRNIFLFILITGPFIILSLITGNLPSNFFFGLFISNYLIISAIEIQNNKLQNQMITNNILIALTFCITVIFILSGVIYFSFSDQLAVKVKGLQDDFTECLSNITGEEFANNLMGINDGGISGGELGTINKVKYKYDTQLEVTTPWVGKDIFLKGYVGGQYTGSGWEDISDSDNEKIKNILLVNYFSVDSVSINGTMTSIFDISKKKNMDYNYQGEIKIKNINANKNYVYLPYNTLTYYSGVNMTCHINKDLYLQFVDNRDEYEFSYYPEKVDLKDYKSVQCEVKSQLGLKSLMIESTYNDKTRYKNSVVYSAFVHDTYTKLPDLEGINQIKNKYQGRYYQTLDIAECVNEAISAVQDGTKYDLSPGKLPKGKDFVNYFLYENKKGFCTHYASAATVILRAMGVPTRYVEGYVIRKQDAENAVNTIEGALKKTEYNYYTKTQAASKLGISEDRFLTKNIGGYYWDTKYDTTSCEIKTIDLKDTNAHAWVEVYIDEIGWIPVDVTPSIGDTVVGSKKDTAKDNATSSREQQGTTQASQNTTIANNIETDNKDSIDSADKALNGDNIIKVKYIISLLALFLIVNLALAIRVKIIVIKRKKSFFSEDQNKNIQNLYNYLFQMFDFTGDRNTENLSKNIYAKNLEQKYSFIEQGEFNRVIDIILKAVFSQHKSTNEERDIVLKFAIKFGANIYSSFSWFKKLKFYKFKY